MKLKYSFILMFFLNCVNHIFPLTKSEANKLAKELVREAKNGNFSSLEKFANKKANLNYQDTNGKTILMYAVQFKRNDIIDKLKKYNIDPNLLDGDNLSALMHAASSLDMTTIKHLLEFKNLNINRQGKYGQTALDFAYTPRALYGEQVEYLGKFKELPKERKDLIDFFKKHGGKTANQLDGEQKNKEIKKV